MPDPERTRRAAEQAKRAGELDAQGLPRSVIAARLGVSPGQASKLLKRAREDALKAD